jgi:hypothetical protein
VRRTECEAASGGGVLNMRREGFVCMRKCALIFCGTSNLIRAKQRVKYINATVTGIYAFSV